MTITQRIELRRLGYSKDEIAELAAQEKEELETVQAEPVETAEAPEPPSAPENNINNADLLAAINNLTSALQTRKVNTTEQPLAEPETAENIFNNILKG